MDKFETVVWMSDLHVPYHNKKSVGAVYKLVKDLKPKTIVIGGDFMDFYSVSSFDKDPSRSNRFQEELDEGNRMLKRLKTSSPSSQIIYLEGNHEDRLMRYLKKNPELYNLRSLEIPALLGLKELGILYKKEYQYKKFLFKHGDYINKYSANKELEVEGISGMSGHSHRNQMMSRTNRQGDMAWYGIGHLSDESKADYIKGVANWQQGIAVINFEKRGTRFHVTPIPIVHDKFIYNGREYR